MSPRTTCPFFLRYFFFFFNDTATTEIYTLSLHDALPIYRAEGNRRPRSVDRGTEHLCQQRRRRRSEEHTSELQSQSNLVCRLLLEKKKQIEADGPVPATQHAMSHPPRLPMLLLLRSTARP